MNTQCVIAVAALFLATSAFADGNAAKGKTGFNKCKSCHSIVDVAGDTIVKGGRTGPNLFGVIGRTAGTGDFRYSKTLIAAGEGGLIWDQASLAAYTQDPRGFLKSIGTDGRGKMTFKMKKGAKDVAAYLASFSPEAVNSSEGDAPADGAAAEAGDG